MKCNNKGKAISFGDRLSFSKSKLLHLSELPVENAS